MSNYCNSKFQVYGNYKKGYIILINFTPNLAHKPIGCGLKYERIPRLICRQTKDVYCYNCDYYMVILELAQILEIYFFFYQIWRHFANYRQVRRKFQRGRVCMYIYMQVLKYNSLVQFLSLSKWHLLVTSSHKIEECN